MHAKELGHLTVLFTVFVFHGCASSLLPLLYIWLVQAASGGVSIITRLHGIWNGAVHGMENGMER